MIITKIRKTRIIIMQHKSFYSPVDATLNTPYAPSSPMHNTKLHPVVKF